MSPRTRLERLRPQAPPRAGELTFEERVALFVGTVHRQRSAELLAGLVERSRLRAVAFIGRLEQADSSQRQAQLAHVFGARPDALDRLRELVVHTQGQLRRAVCDAMGPLVRRQLALPPRHDDDDDAPLAVRALAGRLVREVSRTAPTVDGREDARP